MEVTERNVSVLHLLQVLDSAGASGLVNFEDDDLSDDLLGHSLATFLKVPFDQQAVVFVDLWYELTLGWSWLRLGRRNSRASSTSRCRSGGFGRRCSRRLAIAVGGRGYRLRTA